MKKAVVAFGRLNPPTVGHEKLANKIKSVASKEKAKPFIYLSHSQDRKKNPLDYNTKIRIASKAFGNLVTKSSARNIIEVLKELQTKRFTDIVIVAGADRISEFKNLVTKYNGKEYNFDSIDVVSAGERDPDAEGVEGMSASKLRDLAKKGDYDTFKQGMPKKLSNSDIKSVYDTIRKGSGINEEIEDEDDYDLTDDDIEELIRSLEALDDEDWDDILGDDEDDDDEDDEDDDEDEDDEDDDEEEDEDDLEEAPLSIAQRMRRGRIARKYAKRTQRKREIKLRRRASKDDLSKRARRGAIKLLKKRVAGKKGEKYQSLSPSQKISVDRAVAKRMGQVDRIARRLLPQVKRKESERLQRRNRRTNEAFELVEKVTMQQIKDLEKFGDRLLAKFDIDIEFSKHFADRMNDPRNNPDISVAELQALFKKIARNKAKNIIKHKGSEVVLKDIQRDLNLPVVIKTNGKEMDVVHKTIMRKKNFTTPNPVVKYESVDQSFETFLESSDKNRKALEEKAEKTNIDFEILESIYNRGLESYKTANRPHLSESQWAWARVNSFIAGGHARERDADLLEAEDSDIGNRAGSQPKKYFSGLKKSTKVARDRHFKRGAKMDDDNPSAYKLAPGDKDAETKPSKHTKSFKQMFGEEIKNKQLMHHGKTTKNFEMCPSALKAFDKNQKDGMGDNPGFHDAVVAVDKYLGFEKSTLKKDKSTTADLQKMQELVADAKTKIEKANLKGHDYHQIHVDAVKNHMKGMNEVFEEFMNLEESQIEALKKKSEKSGVSYSILKKVYDRGIAAWRTGHRPGTTPQQWALARVNSFATKSKGTWGGADKDLAAKVRSEEVNEADPCWDGYKQVGMKKKDGKEVPNCVPEEGGAGEEGTDKLRKRYTKDTPGQKVTEGEAVKQAKANIDRQMDAAKDIRRKNRQTRPTNEEVCCEECANELNETVYEVSEAEYQGKNVTLNKPFRANDGKHDNCVYVKNEKGNVVKVCYGDASMKNRDDNPKARKSFRARHNCDNPGPKWRARYWACKNW
jgi:nicotinic acid mononucleotide adenylyltransferase